MQGIIQKSTPVYDRLLSQWERARSPPLHCLEQINVVAAVEIAGSDRRAVRILLHAAVNIFECELALEFRFQRGNRADELRTRRLKDLRGGHRAVRLDLQEEVWVERMGDLVAGEEDLRHGEELAMAGLDLNMLSGRADVVGKIRTNEGDWQGCDPASRS